MNSKLSAISIGNQKIQIPVWESQSKTPGKTILITAGMDGDEYASIEAAYELIEIYSKKSFAGRIVIIPIVNIPGFEMATSLNPLDNKYPKHIYPGKKQGTSSEQLLYHVSEKYISKADIWIDLHGGALIEKLTPFVWAWETGNANIDVFVKNILSRVRSAISIFDKGRWNKIQTLAKQNVAYILLESGQRGQRHATDIKRHVDWVKQIVEVVHEDKTTHIKHAKVYSRVTSYKASHDGLWYPTVQHGKVNKGEHLGEVISLAGEKLETLKSSEQGTVLWHRTSLNAKRGEILVAITY